MLKRLREVKTAIGSMVISEFWSFWRKTDQVASKRVKDTVLDDAWWERVDLIIRIMDPIISLLRFTDIDKHILGEVYEGWDSMIESVRSIYLQRECPEYETSPEALCDTIHDILVSRWDKNCTPLHCLAHSLNPKYYIHEWLNGGPSSRFPPHMDEFSTSSGRFGGYDVIRDKGAKKPYSWWENHGAISPPLQQLAMRLLSQVTSSSCCKRNWSTNGNLYSVKKSRLEQSRAKTMVVELALANMDLNDPVLEPVRFEDLEGSTSTPADAEAIMDTGEEEDAEESSGDHDDEDSDANFGVD
eukprot:PITA_16927